MKPILVVDDTFVPEEIESFVPGAYKAVLCLFWMAEETRTRFEKHIGAECISLRQVVESVFEWERETTEATLKICTGGPQWRGLAWRKYLEQSLYALLLDWSLAKRAIEFVTRNLMEEEDAEIVLELHVAPRVAQAFAQLVPDAPKKWKLELRSYLSRTVSSPRWKRLVRRALEVSFLGGWRLSAWHLVAELDREYKWRTLWRGNQPTGFQVNAITVFSSYANNSRTLSVFTKYLASPIQGVLTNQSAREGLKDAKIRQSWLWQFAPRGKAEVHATDNLPHTGDERLDEWLMQSDLWRNWTAFELRMLVRMTDCWQNYLKNEKPRLIVMASAWGLEGWLAQVARAQSIPVLLFLHGALGGYFYTQTPIEAEGLVVWGEFWRNLWRPQEREKIFVWTLDELFPRVARRPAARRRLTFFSWATSSLPYYNAAELMNGLIEVLYILFQDPEIALTVRFHPAENPSDFIRHWTTKYGAIPHNLRLSKREPLQEILEETDVALMFRSTVLLNCLRNNIPVVMPGWIDFAWNDSLEDVEGIYLAKGFEDLKQQSLHWLEEPPNVSKMQSAWFFDPAPLEPVKWSRYLGNLRINKVPPCAS